MNVTKMMAEILTRNKDRFIYTMINLKFNIIGDSRLS